MNHSYTLRDMAKAFMMVGSHERVDPCLAGADALDTVDRVRNALIFLEEKWVEANEEWHGKFDLYQKARAETLNSTIHLLAEALEGDTE